MTFEHPGKEDIPQLLKLWKEVFGEYDGFWELFLDTAFSPDHCLCITEDDRITAGLYWFDCSCGNDKIAYIYAVVTDPRHRGKGLCRKLMTNVHALLQSGAKADAKAPTLEGLDASGATIQGLAAGREKLEVLEGLDAKRKKAVLANVSNYKILQEAKEMLANMVDPQRLGELLYAHHENLRDGLGVSTPKIDAIIDAAMAAGALGGKVNGSGGGGCGYVYALSENAESVVAAIEALGYPAKIIRQDTGVRTDA